jgi:hypothetical protein
MTAEKTRCIEFRVMLAHVAEEVGVVECREVGDLDWSCESVAIKMTSQGAAETRDDEHASFGEEVDFLETDGADIA